MNALSWWSQRWQVPLLILLVANVARYAYFDAAYKAGCAALSSSHHRQESNVQILLLEGNASYAAVSESGVQPSSYADGPYREAARAVHVLLHKRYHGRECAEHHKRVLSLKDWGGSSVFGGLFRIARAIVLITASADDVAVEWERLVPPSWNKSTTCQNISCLIDHPKPCRDKSTLPSADLVIPDGLGQDCQAKQIISVMRQKAGLQDSKFDFVNIDFFVHEALRFILQPSALLKAQMARLSTEVVPPAAEWKAYMGCCSRIGIYMSNPKYDVYTRTIRLARIHASSYGGPDGVSDIVVKSDAGAFSVLEKRWASTQTQSEKDFLNKSKSYRIRSIDENSRESNDPVMLLAQAYVLAETDFVVGEGSRNFFRFVASLMRLLRFQRVPPAYDALGEAILEHTLDPNGDDN